MKTYIEVREVDSENNAPSNKCICCAAPAEIEISIKIKNNTFQNITESKRMCFMCGAQLESRLRDVNLGRD